MSDPVTPQGIQPKNLANRLKRPTPPTGGTDTITSPPTGPARSEAPKPAGEKPARKPARRRPTPSAVTGTAIYVRPELLEQIRVFRRTTEVTNGDLILDAIEASVDQLPKLVAPKQVSGDGMFARTTRDGHIGKVQLSARLLDENLHVIDELVDQLSAESRSQLIEAALTAYLPAL